jgi:hypothetical protein
MEIEIKLSRAINKENESMLIVYCTKREKDRRK